MYRRAKFAIICFLGMANIGAVYTLSYVAPLSTALQGLYALFGLVMASGLYWGYINQRDHCQVLIWNSTIHRILGNKRGLKLVFALSLFSIGVVVTFGLRGLVLLIALPLLYSIVAAQLLLGERFRIILAELLMTLSFPLILKYLTTGFYFGDGDIATHTYAVERLLHAGRQSAIPLHRYNDIAGFHILTGFSSSVPGLSAYDGIQIVGITTYTVLLLFLFLLIRSVTSRTEIAIGGSIAFVSLSAVFRYANYFYPQALAAGMGMMALYAIHRSQTKPIARRMKYSGLIILAAMVTVHHATIILFFLLIGFLFIVIYSPHIGNNLNRFSLPVYPFVAAGVFAVSYWAYFVDDFILAILDVVVAISGDLTQLLSAGGSGSSTHALGMSLPEPNTVESIFLLVHPEIMYFASLTAYFVFGLLVLDDQKSAVSHALPLVVLGLVSGIVIFKIPLPSDFFVRLRLPLAFFGVFVLCFGITKIAYPSDLSIQTRTVGLLVLVLACSMAPIAAADSLYSLNVSEDKAKQTEFTERELLTIREIGDYTTNYGSDENITTDYSTEVGLSRFGYGTDGQMHVSNGSIVSNSGLFIYQTRWGQHRIHYRRAHNRAQFNQLYLSSKWLKNAVRRENAIYDGGSGGIIFVGVEEKRTSSMIRADSKEGEIDQ